MKIMEIHAQEMEIAIKIKDSETKEISKTNIYVYGLRTFHQALDFALEKAREYGVDSIQVTGVSEAYAYIKWNSHTPDPFFDAIESYYVRKLK